MSKCICIGGGSFYNQELTHIDHYLQANVKPSAKIVFLPLASRDDQGYGKRFKKHYRNLGFEVEVIRLLHTKLTQEELHAKITQCDILYIGGGSTTFLIQQLQNKNLMASIKEAYSNNVILVGMSAGANILFEQGFSDVSEDCFAFVQGIGILKGSFCPHSEEEQRMQALKQTPINKQPLYHCPSKQALVFDNNQNSIFELK